MDKLLSSEVDKVSRSLRGKLVFRTVIPPAHNVTVKLVFRTEGRLARKLAVI